MLSSNLQTSAHAIATHARSVHGVSTDTGEGLSLSRGEVLRISIRQCGWIPVGLNPQTVGRLGHRPELAAMI